MSSSNIRLRVLVVDDFSVVGRGYVDAIRSLNCEVDTANNGKEAVDWFKVGNRFDLVLIEKDMPVMDGPTATKEIREMGIKSRIVGMSSLDGEPEKNAFLASGLNDFRTKPLDIIDIITHARAFKMTLIK